MESNFGKVKKFHFAHKNPENLDKSEKGEASTEPSVSYKISTEFSVR